jgi:phospholipase/carboxylesterase
MKGKPASAQACEKTGLVHELHLAPDPSAPLVFLLHGRHGNVSSMWSFGRAIPSGFNIISAQAGIKDPGEGYCWWLHKRESVSMQEIEDATAGFRRFAASCLEHYRLRPSKIIAMGFSQGAALLSLAVQNRKAFLAGAALLAGYVVQASQQDLPSHKAEIFMAHGSKDQIVKVEQAHSGRDWLKALGFKVHYHEEALGHKVGSNQLKALKAWCSGFGLSFAA